MTAIEHGQKSENAQARSDEEGCPVRRECRGNGNRARKTVLCLPGKGFCETLGRQFRGKNTK